MTPRCTKRQKSLILVLVLTALTYILITEHAWLSKMISKTMSGVATSDEEFTKRRHRLDQVCNSTEVEGHVHGVYTHKSGVIYCYVPKAGCTFWKRVFKAAKFSYIKDPFLITRNLIHSTYGSAEIYSSAHNERAYPIRTLVVRDPFSRLLSSYLDKIYLPDFWPIEAKHILNSRATCGVDFLRNHLDHISSVFDGNSSCSDVMCGKYLTFSDFVAGGIKRREPHWMPIHELCNPCVFNVTHLIYMESFNQDSRAVLKKLNMEQIIDQLDKVSQVDKEISMLIDYHFLRIHIPTWASVYKTCTTPRELAYRLWHSFQWKGYIDPSATFTLPEDSLPESSVREDLLRQVWKARRSGLDNPEVMKEARESFRERAFRSLPRSLFEKLMQKYKSDFELFGYGHIRDTLYSTLY